MAATFMYWAAERDPQHHQLPLYLPRLPLVNRLLLSVTSSAMVTKWLSMVRKRHLPKMAVLRPTQTKTMVMRTKMRPRTTTMRVAAKKRKVAKTMHTRKIAQ
jgi:hypothetical protein